jgi:predicted neuraminidase
MSSIVASLRNVDETWMGIPAIERTAGGRLFVTLFSGGSDEPEPDNHVYITQSDDDGRTFLPPRVIVELPGRTRAFDPALWIDPLGRLWLIYCSANLDTQLHDVHAIICDEPDASELRWSSPRRIGFDVAFAFRLNKPTVTRAGAWLLPVTWHDERDIENRWHTDRELQGVAVSHDAGATWTLHGSVKVPPWAVENMIVERNDGSLVMYIRNDTGVIWKSCSADGGMHWSDGEPTDIANPGSRFFIAKLQSGRWLLINSPSPRHTDRTALVAQLSDDEGRTWGDPFVIDPREDVAYPDAVQAPDGRIWMVYDRDRYRAGEVLLARFVESDLPRPAARAVN